MRKFVVTMLLVVFVATVSFAQRAQTAGDLHPTGKGWGESRSEVGGAATGKARSQTGISYHGGPVMVNQAGNTVYYIWYGNWPASSSTPTILQNLGQNIGGTPYFNINTTYYNGSNVHVKNAITYGGATNDSYSHGSVLTDAGVQAVVANAINTGKLPANKDAVYFVLTSSDVNESSGFCTQYCGWHTHGTIGGLDIKYSFVGSPARCSSACAAQTTSPNSNYEADGMASIIAHELEEAVSDPDLNAWYDNRGQENADKCAWTWGSTSTAANGSKYNMSFGGANWLIQQNWVNAGNGGCAKSY